VTQAQEFMNEFATSVRVALGRNEKLSHSQSTLLTVLDKKENESWDAQ